jgi:diguanylate cyclase (GGDEF)-like protein
VTRAGRCLRVSEHRTPEGHTVGIYTDITNLKQAEEAIRYRAYYDALTALPNRENFMQALADTAAQSRRSRTRAAILFVDLDRFKNINDTLGHETGDLVLREAARRLSAAVRQTDVVARFGGDEFTLILRDVQDANSAARVAQGIIGKLTESYKVGSHVLHTGASIGITLCPDDSTDPQVLLRNADMAMYQAKNRGRHTYQFFTARLTEMARHFVALENDLRLALLRSEFALHFQPIVRLDEGRASGAEALLRWHHPARGVVSPAEFIPVAWVLREACRQGRAWCGDDGLLERIAVNVSSRQFHGGFDVEFVRSILAETGFPADCLVLEMTESLLIENDERILATLAGLRDLGVGLAVDDFGTGYSALSYLRRFPVTTLKIDRSFIADIERSTSDAHLVESIIAMARALRIAVVAEGVETAGQAEMLRGMGCSYAQGYWFGRPVTAAELGERLAAGAADHLAAGG